MVRTIRRDKKKEIEQILTESVKKKDLTDSYKKFLFRLRELINKSSGIPAQGICDRLDWRDISKYQNISPEFYEKWKECIKHQDATPTGKTKPYCSSPIVQGRPARAKRRGKR